MLLYCFRWTYYLIAYGVLPASARHWQAGLNLFVPITQISNFQFQVSSRERLLFLLSEAQTIIIIPSLFQDYHTTQHLSLGTSSVICSNGRRIFQDRGPQGRHIGRGPAGGFVCYKYGLRCPSASYREYNLGLTNNNRRCVITNTLSSLSFEISIRNWIISVDLR